MNDKYKILTEYIKDISCETPDVDTYFYVRENISKYKLSIDINSKPLKNRILEVNLLLRYQDQNLDHKRSYFEITYCAVVKVEENIKDKNTMEKIILCNVPTEIYPKLEKVFISLVEGSGFPSLKIDKKVDFEDLYKKKIN
tara:strand:- start:134 stop:556 length:423 start_codon:yes stop_codon:yes gene_type:complete